jgi:hypothetical protein
MVPPIKILQGLTKKIINDIRAKLKAEETN